MARDAGLVQRDRLFRLPLLHQRVGHGDLGIGRQRLAGLLHRPIAFYGLGAACRFARRNQAIGVEAAAKPGVSAVAFARIVERGDGAIALRVRPIRIGRHRARPAGLVRGQIGVQRGQLRVRQRRTQLLRPIQRLPGSAQFG
ncbi:MULTISPECIES: hypothetical protein [Burkholderia]|uniref:hypothetical protein n=1 Tax=Burkholderia TaxID=32008 RepID=UPI0008416AD7|nr:MULTISPECIES: hypothetical protein [unclassified Burkholderia]AOK31948.1 hypothetical protein AQ611_20875 [Burkholderia sp. Bp7605]